MILSLIRFFSIVWLCCSFSVLSQTFYPEIKNYTIEDYNADNQNWGIDIDKQGVRYIANNKGLLRYNGEKWDLYQLPNKTIIRSVFCSKEKIYTGSYEEFGYWSKDDYGSYQYKSLIHLVNKQHNFQNEEFWEIVEFKENIFFRSFGGLYRYDGELIQFIPNTQGILDFEILENQLVISIRDMGLFKLDAHSLKIKKFNSILGEFKNISSFKSSLDKFIFYDERKGAYLVSNKKVYKLSQQLNVALKSSIVNKITFKSEEQVIFGTIKKGILVYNNKNGTYYYIDKSSGLQNNTVLGLKFNKEQLWIAFDNGIATVNFGNALLYYTDQSGNLGTVYDIVFYKGFYYFASNTGLYKLLKNNKLFFIKGSEGQVWDLHIANQSLLAGHNNGLYLINNDIATPIDLSAGGIFTITPWDHANNVFLLGTYSGILKLKKNPANWDTYKIPDFNLPINKIALASKNVIWAAHPYKDIYRIEFSENQKEIIRLKKYGDHPKFNQNITRPHQFDSIILLQNSGKWFDYNAKKDSIQIYSKNSRILNKNLIAADHPQYWFLNKNDNIQLTNQDFDIIFQFNSTEIQKRIVSGHEKIHFINDSTRALNLNDGLVLFKLGEVSNLKKDQQVYSPPIIEKIKTQNNSYRITDKVTLPFSESRNIRFDAYLPNSNDKDISYELSGEIEENGVLNNGRVTLQNLPYGTYLLVLMHKELSTPIKLRILPPWYLSVYAKLIYLLIFAVMVYLIYLQNKRKIRRQQLQIQRTYIRESQERIAKIEKENLEKEILQKKRELTGSTAAVIKKNEMIIELRNELNRLKEVSPNQYRTKKLLNNSKKYLGDDNDWKIFQSNFNDLHQDFFKKLIASYPKLTTKDLKLCAYIKSGLTTKDIAPLMGITVRGVELHRYRVRKKLSLKPDENFQKFLTFF